MRRGQEFQSRNHPDWKKGVEGVDPRDIERTGRAPSTTRVPGGSPGARAPFGRRRRTPASAGVGRVFTQRRSS